MKRKELEKQRFGKLTVKEWGDGGWVCLCDCGGTKQTSSERLQSGRVVSCGCIREVHGGKKSKLYCVWQRMLSRCHNQKDKDWKYYGQRGIRVEPVWLKFSQFRTDMGKPSPGDTIERIDNNGNYGPNNCRWATRKEQARNTRRSVLLTFNNKTQSLAQWAEELNVSCWKLYSHRRMGWSEPRMFADLVSMEVA